MALPLRPRGKIPRSNDLYIDEVTLWRVTLAYLERLPGSPKRGFH
jgi:hypothetical protein